MRAILTERLRRIITFTEEGEKLSIASVRRRENDVYNMDGEIDQIEGPEKPALRSAWVGLTGDPLSPVRDPCI